jgi:tetratricopeptide (TPR) repeat protein
LVSLQRAYVQLNRGDAMMAAGRLDAALAAYEAATQIIPDSATDGEAAFWAGVAFAGNGHVEEAVPYLARAAAFGQRWKKLLPRLVRSEMFRDDDALLERALEAVSPEEP